jgi:hypothetical protein
MTKLTRFLRSFLLNEHAPPVIKSQPLPTAAFLAFALSACHTPKQSTSPQQHPFTLIEASSQQWTAGRQEGGRGTDYYFKLALHTAAIRFDSMWVDNKVLPVFIARETITVSGAPITYAAGDTIILRGSWAENAAVPNQAAPVKGAAAFRYLVNQQPAYYSIEQIERKQAHNLPSHY